MPNVDMHDRHGDTLANRNLHTGFTLTVVTELQKDRIGGGGPLNTL